MRDVLPLLRKQEDLEKAFVVEAAAKSPPSSGWTPSMTMPRFRALTTTP